MGDAFVLRIKRENHSYTEIFMQSEEVARLVKALAARRHQESNLWGPGDNSFKVYEAVLNGDGKSWTRGADRTEAQYVAAWQTMQAAMPNSTTYSWDGSVLRQGKVNLVALCHPNLATGVVISLEAPMPPSLLQEYSDKLVAVVKDLQAMAKPVYISRNLSRALGNTGGNTTGAPPAGRGGE